LINIVHNYKYCEIIEASISIPPEVHFECVLSIVIYAATQAALTHLYMCRLECMLYMMLQS